jgi:hypothetical protein
MIMTMTRSAAMAELRDPGAAQPGGMVAPEWLVPDFAHRSG